MGHDGAVCGWALIVSVSILTSNTWGALTGEWDGSGTKPRLLMWLATALLICSFTFLALQQIWSQHRATARAFDNCDFEGEWPERENSKILRAGAARSVITPPVGLTMAGFAARDGRAQDKESELFATALVLSDDRRRSQSLRLIFYFWKRRSPLCSGVRLLNDCVIHEPQDGRVTDAYQLVYYLVGSTLTKRSSTRQTETKHLLLISELSLGSTLAIRDSVHSVSADRFPRWRVDAKRGRLLPSCREACPFPQFIQDHEVAFGVSVTALGGALLHPAGSGRADIDRYW
jgi:hypothetical protein